MNMNNTFSLSFSSVFSSVSAVVAELRQSLRLAFPLIATELVYALSGFIITAMTAHLGRDELATQALVWATFVTLILFFIGIFNAVSILVAQSYGAKDEHGVCRATTQGLVLAGLSAIPMIALLLFAPKFLQLTHQKQAIINFATSYFYSLVWCILPLNWLIVLEQFLIGIGRTRIVMLMSMIEVPLEILGFYAFIFGHFGMPRCGLAGVGYGFAFATTILSIFITLFIHYEKGLKRYRIFHSFGKIDKKYLYELFRVGTPLGIMYCLEVALFSVAAFMMSNFGEDMLAAHQIAYQCFTFALMIAFGVSQSATVRVGHEVGRNNKKALILSAFVHAALGFGFMLVFAAGYLFLPKYIIALDVDIHAAKYQTLLHYATTLLGITGVLQLTEAFRNIGVGVLRGLKDTTITLYLSVISFWFIAFPAAYLLAFVFHLGGIGIWWGIVIGLASSAVFFWGRFLCLVKRVDLAALVTK